MNKCEQCSNRFVSWFLFPCNSCSVSLGDKDIIGNKRTDYFKSKIGAPESPMFTHPAMKPNIETNPTDNIEPKAKDPGAHYRYAYKGIKFDPAMIAFVYGGMTGMQFTILKKCLRMGTGGKSKEQDLLDIISAANRELELIREGME